MEQFYLELMDIFNEKVYRLQNDRISWRRLNSDKLKQSDFTTSDPEEVISLQKRACEIELEGANRIINNSTGNILNELFYKVRVNRRIFPKTPEKEQLISVIRKGINKEGNALILNVNGLFELRDSHTLNLSEEDPTIILRYSTFCKGNDCVGKKASKDIAFIDELYARALALWAWHFQNKSTKFFCEFERTQKGEESLGQIEEEKMK